MIIPAIRMRRLAQERRAADESVGRGTGEDLREDGMAYLLAAMSSWMR